MAGLWCALGPLDLVERNLAFHQNYKRLGPLLRERKHHGKEEATTRPEVLLTQVERKAVPESNAIDGLLKAN